MKPKSPSAPGRAAKAIGHQLSPRRGRRLVADKASHQARRSGNVVSRAATAGLDYFYDSIDMFSEFLFGFMGDLSKSDSDIATRARARKSLAGSHNKGMQRIIGRDRRSRSRDHEREGKKLGPWRVKNDPRPLRRWLLGLSVGDQSGKKWRRREDSSLANMAEQRYSAREAGLQLGRSESAVRARAKKLGIYFRSR